MKAITVRLTERLAADIDAEARGRGVSRSAVIRERLERAGPQGAAHALAEVADLIGSVDGLPVDLSAHKKVYLRHV